MQPSYALSDFGLQQHHQYSKKPSSNTNSPDFPISIPQNVNHPFHPIHHLQNEQHKQEQQHVFLLQQQQNHQFFQQHQQLRPPFLLHHQQQQLQEHKPEEVLHRQIRQQQQQYGQHPSLFTVDFKLGLNEDSGCSKKVGAFVNQEAAAAATTAYIHGNEDSNHHPPPLPPHPHHPHGLLLSRGWDPREDSATIKEPFWKQLNSGGINNQGSGIEEQSIQGNKRARESKQLSEIGTERCKNLDGKFRVFSELEAIYNLATIGETNQAGSGSALTGENQSPSPRIANISMPFEALHGQNVDVTGAEDTAIGVDNDFDVSDDSIGEETALRKRRKMKMKRRMKEGLECVGVFIEKVVKKVIDHQEMLHKNFLEVIQRMDKERTEREETWRRQESVKQNREAAARAQEQARASTREAQIMAYIEKITGQCIPLPARVSPLLMKPGLDPNEHSTERMDGHNGRWPQSEVEALIQVRSSVETKFQEPGIKGPLWDEVSSLMSAMGYQRSAKRCKEKWENINKYFKKAKENTSTKKRSSQSKTCSYFHQLDQLYSKPYIAHPPSSIISQAGMQKQSYSEPTQSFTATITSPPTSDNIGSPINDIVEDRLRTKHRSQGQDHDDDHEDKNGEETRDGCELEAD